jgi:hypothetical protein
MKFQSNQDLPIYELKINESLNDESEVSYVALVDLPAIKKDFLAFKEEFINPSKGEHKTEFLPRCISYVINEGKESEQAVAICNSIWEEHFAEDMPHYTKDGKLWTGPTHKDSTGRLMTGATHTKDSEYLYHEGEYAEESYNDYPKEASENAKIALNYAEKNGWGDCGTPVGKIRANQLAKGEPISRDTIARMSAFERHRQNSQKDLGDGCGRLMWLAWGGDAGVEWATRKLNQIDKFKHSFQIISEDEHIISGPLMLADQLIYRDNEKFGEHYVKFSPDTIKDIAIKFAKRKYQSNVNLMHDPSQVVEGVTMFESFIVDKKRGVLPMSGFEDVADGSWFGSFYVENNEVWNQVKSGELRGFSVEGLFDYEEPKKQLSPEEQALKKIEELLKEIN